MKSNTENHIGNINDQPMKQKLIGPFNSFRFLTLVSLLYAKKNSRVFKISCCVFLKNTLGFRQNVLRKTDPLSTFFINGHKEVFNDVNDCIRTIILSDSIALELDKD